MSTQHAVAQADQDPGEKVGAQCNLHGQVPWAACMPPGTLFISKISKPLRRANRVMFSTQLSHMHFSWASQSCDAILAGRKWQIEKVK